MSFQKKISILISVLLLILCFLLNWLYRSYIYKNHIYDFHIADSFTSWLCVPCGALFFWGIAKRTKFVKILFSSFIGFVICEFWGLTFDWFDLLALFLSTSITFIIYFFYKKHRTKYLQ